MRSYGSKRRHASDSHPLQPPPGSPGAERDEPHHQNVRVHSPETEWLHDHGKDQEAAVVVRLGGGPDKSAAHRLDAGTAGGARDCRSQPDGVPRAGSDNPFRGRSIPRDARRCGRADTTTDSSLSPLEEQAPLCQDPDCRQSLDTSTGALIRVPFLPNLQAQSAGCSGVSPEALELRNPLQTSVGHST